MSEYGTMAAPDERCTMRMRPAVAAFLLVAAAQLWLVGAIGTDIPILDQWDAEGADLYPAYVDGSLTWHRLVQAHNEHRIVFTQLWNLGLFVFNGAWDPLVQLFAGVVLRAVCAGALAAVFAGRQGGKWTGAGWAAVLAVAYLPILSWHNVLWGFQSSVWFSLGLATAALALWGGAEGSPRRLWLAWGLGAAAQFAMGPGLLVPVALVGWIGVRLCECRGRVDRGLFYECLGGAGLLTFAILQYMSMPMYSGLVAHGLGQWLWVFARVLAWPHTDIPVAALVMNAPLAALLLLRLVRPEWRREEDGAALLFGFWTIALAGATAWSRGGGWELALGLPSRYVDFIVVLPLVNLWCAFRLASGMGEHRRPLARLGVALFAVFVAVGLAGQTATALRRIIVPRFRDPSAPVRLAIAYHRTWDTAVYDRQPRFYRLHDDLGRARAVLQDRRLLGKLPPSFQPEQPLGPLSRAVRWCAARRNLIAGMMGALGVLALFWCAQKPAQDAAGPDSPREDGSV